MENVRFTTEPAFESFTKPPNLINLGTVGSAAAPVGVADCAAAKTSAQRQNKTKNRRDNRGIVISENLGGSLSEQCLWTLTELEAIEQGQSESAPTPIKTEVSSLDGV